MKYKIGDMVYISIPSSKTSTVIYEITDVHNEGNAYRLKDMAFWWDEKELNPATIPEPFEGEMDFII